jgi:hypothetical protein
MWRRGLQRRFPAFVAFALLIPTAEIATYLADISPRINAENFWRIVWAGLLLEAALKIVLMGEVFSRVFGDYASVASLGKSLIRGTGAALVLAAVLVAALAQRDNHSWLISGAHLLQQTIYFVECGLLLFIFAFAAYFRLTWDNSSFGIALGLGVSACVHLGTWAVMANGGLPGKRNLLDFLNMATYHVCVLIWIYYLLFPQKVVPTSAVLLPENNLDIWNRELERLLQQ